jgi:NhaP-type Na+/H+ or K+/H+ antiporter
VYKKVNLVFFIFRSGYGLSNKEFYVIVWGGLRGALGITLALMVAVDDKLDKRLRELTIFYMAGLATLTLLINGTTCK